MSHFSVAKEKVIDDLENIVEQLLRASRKHKRQSLWNVINPYRAKAKADQMVVWLQGARRGAWRDFVSGDAGDAIDLVAYALTGDVNPDSPTSQCRTASGFQCAEIKSEPFKAPSRKHQRRTAVTQRKSRSR